MRKSVKSMLSPLGKAVALACSLALALEKATAELSAGCLLQFELGLEILFFRFLFIFRLF